MNSQGTGSSQPSKSRPGVVLASTSRYRAQLLERLCIPFHTDSPRVDESRHPNETPEAMARRLAEWKARAVAEHHPAAIVIGSDQVAALGDRVLGKPGTREQACADLLSMSACSVEFLTAVHVLDTREPAHAGYALLDRTRVQMRTLGESEIERYVSIEQPLDCAGSFKVEGLGISLFEHMEMSDPTALVGLPLIGVARVLRELGVAIPAPHDDGER